MSPDNDRKWLALILLCAVQFMVVLDVAIVNVALPTIKNALDFSDANLQWVVSAYTLTFGGFLMLGSRIADLLGRKRCSWPAWCCSRPRRWPAAYLSRTRS
jgi:Major Facilitator Superfamily.